MVDSIKRQRLAFEHYAFWLADLGYKELPNARSDKTFTVAGLLKQRSASAIFRGWWRIGTDFSTSPAVLEARPPMEGSDLVARVVRTGKTGWYFRVLREGNVQPERTGIGDALS